MFTTEEIQKFYDHVEGLGLKFPVAAIAKATGYGKGNVSAYLSRKDEPSENFIKAVYEKFPIGSKKVSRSTVSASNMPEITGAELLRAITTLTESNKGLVDSNRSITDTNRVIADTNAILAQKLIKEDSTAGAPSDNPLTDPATLKVLLDALAVVGSGEHPWRSKEEGVAVLNSQILKLSGEVGKKPGTQTGADRLNTGRKAQ